MLIKLLQTSGHFLYPLKSLEHQRHFLCFLKAYKETSGKKSFKSKNLTSKHSYGFKKTIMAKLVKQCNNFVKVH